MTTESSLKIHFNPDLCTGCSWCIDECSKGVIILRNDVAVIAYPELCIRCGVCINVCPSEARSSV